MVIIIIILSHNLVFNKIRVLVLTIYECGFKLIEILWV